MRALLYYLRRYLEADPKRRPRLFAAYQRAAGVPLDRTALWRQLQLRVSDVPGSTLLIYLGFLNKERAIIFGDGPGALFTYAHPQLLKAK